MPRLITALSLLVCCVALAADAQVPGPKPGSKPTVFVGPASLSAVSGHEALVTLLWPPIAGAERYRITRIENAGDSEATIAELPQSALTNGRSVCVAGSYSPLCVFQDVSKIGSRPVGNLPSSGDLTSPSGTIYPHGVTSGKVYTYRVWGLFANGVVSPPSPPATVVVK
jgi:hypothetical protein